MSMICHIALQSFPSVAAEAFLDGVLDKSYDQVQRIRHSAAKIADKQGLRDKTSKRLYNVKDMFV